MSHEAPVFDAAQLEAMNAKAVENQFFTPDKVYIEMSLLKDYPIGVAYADMLQHRGQAHFEILQKEIMSIVTQYQMRDYDTIDPYLGKFGYTDAVVEDLLHNTLSHDLVFAVSPTTKFFNTLIRHTVRNQNNSGPANKFTKQSLGNRQYMLKPIDVTYYFNTYPLSLSAELMTKLAFELGEAFGVNIQFMNKDPMTFDRKDWHDWLSKIDCFYFNSLPRFLRSEFILQKQGDMAFAGCYFFARKRFETCVMKDVAEAGLDNQLAVFYAHISVFCDFEWIQDNDTRLTEAPIVSVSLSDDQYENETPS